MKKLNIIGLLALFLATSTAPILGMKKGKEPKESKNSIQTLAPEILTAIFEYLDARSHAAARNVCPKWRAVLDSMPDYDYTKTLPLEILTAILTNNELSHDDRLQARLVCRLWDETITENVPMIIINPLAEAATREPGEEGALFVCGRQQAVVAIPQLRLPRRFRMPSVTDYDMPLAVIDPSAPALDDVPGSKTRSLSPRSSGTQSRSPKPSPREVVVRYRRISPVPLRVFTDGDKPRKNQAGTAPHPSPPMNPATLLLPLTPTTDYDGDYSNSANAGNADYSSDSE